MKSEARRSMDELLLDIRDQRAMELAFDEECMSAWELLRRRRRPSALPEIAAAMNRSVETTRVLIERLIEQKLVERIRASSRRKQQTFRVTSNRVGIGIRWDDPEDRNRWDLLAPKIERSAHRLRQNQRATAVAGDDGVSRVTYLLPLRLSASEMAELRQRFDELTAFLRLLQERHTGESGPDDFVCNYRFELQLQPLAEAVLPQPFLVVRMLDRSASRGDSRLDPLAHLSPRERQVALAIVRGRSRGQTATELGLKPGTVATLTKRIYRKLGISGRVELTRCVTATPGGLGAVA